MSCEHCAKAVTKALENLPGVAAAAVDLKAKTVTIEHDTALAAVEKIKSEIENQGYDVIG